jgi:hypothetical protein
MDFKISYGVLVHARYMSAARSCFAAGACFVLTACKTPTYSGLALCGLDTANAVYVLNKLSQVSGNLADLGRSGADAIMQSVESGSFEAGCVTGRYNGVPGVYEAGQDVSVQWRDCDTNAIIGELMATLGPLEETSNEEIVVDRRWSAEVTYEGERVLPSGKHFILSGAFRVGHEFLKYDWGDFRDAYSLDHIDSSSGLTIADPTQASTMTISNFTFQRVTSLFGFDSAAWYYGSYDLTDDGSGAMITASIGWSRSYPSDHASATIHDTQNALISASCIGDRCVSSPGEPLILVEADPDFTDDVAPSEQVVSIEEILQRNSPPSGSENTCGTPWL